MKTSYELVKVFDEADAAWSRLLQEIFGKEAGDARYDKRGKGTPGGLLHTAHANREAARVAWSEACDRERAEARKVRS